MTTITDLINSQQEEHPEIYEIFESVKDVEKEYGTVAAFKEIYFRYFTAVEKFNKNFNITEVGISDSFKSAGGQEITNILKFMLLMFNKIPPPPYKEYEMMLNYPNKSAQRLGMDILLSTMLKVAQDML